MSDDPIWKKKDSCVKKRDADYDSLSIEKKRCMAEATGVFFYVFAGISATTVFTINQENAAFGSIFQIGTFIFPFQIFQSFLKKNPPFSSPQNQAPHSPSASPSP